MLISDFDYILPDAQIAEFGPKVRGESKLLVLNRENGNIYDNLYKNLDQYLHKGDLVVLNNTKVIPARLYGVKNLLDVSDFANQPKNIEILLTEFHTDNQENLLNYSWKVVYNGNIKIGDQIWFGPDKTAKVIDIYLGGLAQLQFDYHPVTLAQEIGEMPIPPYLKRGATVDDFERYQTEFGQKLGSVAAPTASLNFTNQLTQRLLDKGVQVEYITLHVGLGTFMPVRVDKVSDHTMHAEYFEIPMETVLAIQNTKINGNRVLAVGTTVCRTLEHASKEIQESTTCQNITGEADIFIYPSYRFKLVDMLLTNFHAPRSTPLLLVSAFTGFDLLMKGYTHALNNDYKFLSFGDSCLIE